MNKQEQKTPALEAWQSITRDKTQHLVMSTCLRLRALNTKDYGSFTFCSLKSWRANVKCTLHTILYTVHLIELTTLAVLSIQLCG